MCVQFALQSDYADFVVQTVTQESKWDMPEELQALMDTVGKDTQAPG